MLNVIVRFPLIGLRSSLRLTGLLRAAFWPQLTMAPEEVSVSTIWLPRSSMPIAIYEPVGGSKPARRA
jgi:hypothetical protein